MSKRRKLARRASERAGRTRAGVQLSARWQDAHDARTSEVRTTGAVFTRGQEPTQMGLRANGQPASHDLSRGMDAHGTYRQPKAPKAHKALIRAWEHDEIRWNPRGTARIYQMDGPDIITGSARGCTEIAPRVRNEEPVVETLAPAREGRARDRRIDNTIGYNAGWSDAQAKAEQAFARELRAG